MRSAHLKGAHAHHAWNVVLNERERSHTTRSHLRNPTYHRTCPLPGGEKCVVDVMHDVGALLVDGEHSGARCVPVPMWAWSEPI